MSYQQPPDDPYNQQTRAASWPSQPSYPPPGQQGSYQQQPYQQPQQNYGSADAQNAWPQQNQPAAQPGYQAQPGGQAAYQAAPATAAYPVQPAAGYQAPGYQVQAQGSRGGHRQSGGKQYGLRGAESVWYVIFCIYFGLAYFAKIPSKKAACEVFSELQLDGQGPSRSYALNGWETFWYILQCIAFGSGYFRKVWAKKSLWEIVNMMRAAPADQVQALTRALTGPGSGSQYPQRF